MTSDGRADFRPAADGAPPMSASVDHTVRGMFGRDSVYLVVWVVQIIAAAAATPIMTRLLGVDEFGTVAAATAVMQVLFVLTTCGLHVAVQRWFTEPGGQQAAARILTLSMVVAVLVTTAAMATGPAWSSLLGFRGFHTDLALAVLWAGGCAVTSCGLALLRSQDKLLGYALVSLMQSVVAQGFSLGFVLLQGESSEAYLSGQVLAQLVAVGVALFFAPPRRIRLQDLPLVRAGLSFGLPLVPAMLGSFVLQVADRLMLQDTLGYAAVARYQVAYNIGDLPMLVLGTLTTLWLPRFFAAAPDERQAVLAASRTALKKLLAPTLIGMSVASPIALRLWAPPEFLPMHLLGVTALIILAAVPFTAVQSATRDLLSRGATKAVAWSTAAAAVLNIGLNLALIPAMGITGAAAATLLAYVAQHGLLMLVTGRQPTSRGERVASLRLVVAGALCLAVVFLPTSPAGLALRLVLALGCLAWLGRSLWRITREPPPVADLRTRGSLVAPSGRAFLRAGMRLRSHRHTAE